MKLKLFENWGEKRDLKESDSIEDINPSFNAYFEEVGQGDGWVSVDKVIHDYDYEYDTHIDEEDVLKYVKSKSDLSKISLDGVDVILTKQAPEVSIIAKDLGLDDSYIADERSYHDYGPDIEEYFEDIYRGEGWVTLEKALTDLDYEYDIQTNSTALIEWVKRHSNLVNYYRIKNIPLILTKSAPSFKNILMDLGY